jgi:hypothetical protein
MQLARLCVAAARHRLACHTANLLLHTSACMPSDDPRSRDINETTGTPGSEGAAPGRGPDAGTDADLKFGDKDACRGFHLLLLLLLLLLLCALSY